MANVTRIRLTQVPAPRDLEYLSLRYLRINGVYDLPTSVAVDLMDLGVATLVDGEPVSDFEPFSPDDINEK